MDILAFLGSPRKNGNSETLLRALLKGMELAGGQAELIRLPELDISPCLNCGGCDDTGECIVEDDMTPLYEKIARTKIIVLASPIFFYGITAQAKAFIDRNQALWNRRRLLREQGKWQADPERRGFFVSVAATKGPRVFEGAVLCMKYGFDAMLGTIYSGELLVRGYDQQGEMTAAGPQLQEAEKIGRDFILQQAP